LRIEKPALSASRNQVEVNVNLAERLGAARKRVKEMKEVKSVEECAELKRL
jgi:hypothetical protein